ncbi:MAG: (Fe-S)-binding protein [Cytophagaceae bacterium]|jgi:heterodisulfide reductase subunit C|nr:(Fe-S)-binding protein [Cytophagaceae bacterium]
MQVLSSSVFAVVLVAAGYGIYKSINRIRKNILIGRPEERSDNPIQRFKNVLLLALGQKKMFKKPLPALLHAGVYLGFLIVNIEMLEIVLDGLLGTHRLFFPLLGTVYPILISIFELFALAVIISCVVFLARRWIVKVPRFSGIEMTSAPTLDATIILIVEIVLMKAFLFMNACDLVLQSRGEEHYWITGSFLVSSSLTSYFTSFSSESLMWLERAFWWIHIIGVLAFANYVFYHSKHLHIFMAFINAYYVKLNPAGQMSNMPEVTKEVRLMLNLPVEENSDMAAPVRFGAKDVTDLSWVNILNAYSCTECGRCTQQCPANITGKKLSPRKIMMDIRDRAEEIGLFMKQHEGKTDDGKALLGDYISEEEILACTTCNACVEACPVGIDPVDIIVQLRRYQLMELSKAPSSWTGMLSNLENNFAPWKFSPSDRFNWASKLNG